MATIADELLNDFGDSDDDNDENGNENENGNSNEFLVVHGDGVEDVLTGAVEGKGKGEKTDMELDDENDEDENDDDDKDENAPSHLTTDTAEDAEEAKARVEKMALHHVSDVRTVAGLMKQLDPLLEVSQFIHIRYTPLFGFSLPSSYSPLWFLFTIIILPSSAY